MRRGVVAEGGGEEGIDEFHGVEDLQVLGLFAHADEADGDVEFLGDADDHAAAGRAVQLGEDQAGDFGGSRELAGLFEGVLAGGAVEDQENLMRNAGGDLLHDALDLGQLVHQVLLVVEAPSRIDQDHVVPLATALSTASKATAAGSASWPWSDEIGPGALSPDPKLVHGRGPERVGGSDGDLEAALGELVAEFADGGGLAHAVDPDDEEDIGAFGLGQVQVGGLVAPVGLQHAGDFLAEHGQQTVDGGGVLSGGPVLDAFHDLHRGLHADVAGDQGLLEFFEHVGVDVLLAGDGPGELLQNTRLERARPSSRVCFFSELKIRLKKDMG